MKDYKQASTIMSDHNEHHKNSNTIKQKTYLNHLLELNDEQIKKSAKKLQKSLLAMPELNALVDKEKVFSLMKCQNIISQSLGFDSFYAVQQYSKQYNISQLEKEGILLLDKNNDSNNVYVGEIFESNKKVYLNNKTLQKHSFFISEKESNSNTVKINLLEQAIKNKTTLIYFENRGDSSSYQDIFKLARKYNREDDLLIINYMTGVDNSNKQ